jgi:tetratricopeptide (TPR) repeat protein
VPHATKESSSNFEQQQRFQLRTSRQEQTNEDPLVTWREMKQPASESSLSPAYNVINDALTKRSRYEQGEANYQRMIAADIDALGPNHPSVANDLTGLAQLYISQERFAEAEPLLQRALSIYQQSYGANNLLSINTLSALATAESQTGHVDKAIDLYRTALSSAQRSLGPNSMDTARILNGLAHLYYQQGKLQESCTLYKWAVASTEASIGKDDPLLAACLKDYAQVLRSLGRDTDATVAETRAEQILANAK